MKKTVLILSFSPLDRDPRVFRQILFLKSNYNLITAGFTSSPFVEIKFYPIKYGSRLNYLNLLKKCQKALLRSIKCFDKAYWKNEIVKNAYNKLKQEKFDLILTNDVNTLPLAIRLAHSNDAKVIIDAHEYTPRDFDDKWTFRVFMQDYWDGICRKHLQKTDAMFTVCPGLADEYHRNYGIKCQVLTNAPFFEDLKPKPVGKKNIKMIHHGGLNTSRRLENMIYLLDKLDDRFTLDLMLVNNNTKYFKKLKLLSKDNKKIRFIDPVSMTKISRTINAYDIGLFLLWPGSFSYKMALPNKLFEFIQGRLAVAIWPSPEMAKIVNKFELGVISDDYTVDSMANKLNILSTTEIMHFKLKSHNAAIHLCAEKNKDLLLHTVKDLIGV
jgi:hypothetical protein